MKCYKVCALATKDLPIYKLFKTILDRLFYLSIYGFNCGSTSAGMTFGRSALQSILLFGTAIRNRSHEAIWDQSLCQYLLLLLYEWRNSSLNKWNGECEYDSVYSIYFPSIFSSATGSLHVLHAFRYRLDSVKWSAPRSELKNHREKNRMQLALIAYVHTYLITFRVPCQEPHTILLHAPVCGYGILQNSIRNVQMLDDERCATWGKNGGGLQ